MKYFEISKVSKSFGERNLFQDVSFSFEKKGFYALIGDSGSGKSTLLDLLAGIDDDFEGDIYLFGRSLQEMDEDQKAEYRLRDFGFIRQSYDLLELDDALSNVTLPLDGLGISKRIAKRKALETLQYLGIKDKAKTKVSLLSGGEKQRVAIARAIVGNPEIILADEPTGSLDRKNAVFVYDVLRELAKNKLVIVVTHDLSLIKDYADVLLYLQDGRMNVEENKSLPEASKKKDYLTFSVKRNDKGAIPLFTWLKHAVHLLENKKKRSLLSIFIVAFSLISLGASVFVKRNLEKELNSAFSSLSGIEGFVMEEAASDNGTFGKIMSSPHDKVAGLKARYPSVIADYGSIYLAPFESYFPDQNQFFFDSNGQKSIITSLSARSINDYLWLDKVAESKIFYPEKPSILENEQIILGVPHSTMVSMCLAFHVQRDYEHLGDYLLKNPLSIYLETANESWGYTDLELLQVVGVTKDEVPSIYHYRHDWNSYMFEEVMGFPSFLEDDSLLPWILRQIYYIYPQEDKASFFSKAQENGLLDEFVFERDGYDYDQSHNEKGKASSSQRLFVYLADKKSLLYRDILEISATSGIESYSVLGEGSYSCFPSSLASGFSSPFFLSDSLSTIEGITDAISNAKSEDVAAKLSVPPNVSMGYFLRPASKSLTISSDCSSLLEGKKPLKPNEVVLSKPLFDKLNSPSEVYGGGLVERKEEGERIFNDYRLGKMKVVGVADSSSEVMYVTNSWSIDYWRDYLGMSSFLLEPKQVIFHGKNRSPSLLPSLSSRYPRYRFVDPSAEIENSISDVIRYLSIVLRFASVLCLVTSSLLLVVSAMLIGFEHKKEGPLLFNLGVKRKEIVSCYGMPLAVITLYSCLLSIFSLVAAEFGLSDAIRRNFSSNASAFSIDFFSIVLMLLASLAGLLITVFFIFYRIKKQDFRRGGIFR